MTVNDNKNRMFELFFEDEVEEVFSEEIVPVIKKWLKEKVIKNLQIEVLKYKRDEHECINTGITARLEEKAKEYICPRIPSYINSDHLTLIGFIGILLCAAGFILGSTEKLYLFLVIIGLFINWFGDSFDGSLARFRKKTRPNYGYYIDHTVDSLSIIVAGIGFGYSSYVRIDLALIMVALYLALETHALIVKTIENTFKLSFGLLGPTEFRIIISLLVIYMYFSKTFTFFVWGQMFSQYDIAITILSLIMFITFITTMFKTGIDLHKKDVSRW
ncbi:CDP-alcohol phosphatidyltransferase family protein [bacterium]|nr:CDP-alcohol phosphatidyltransferase family protein [bacterium]